MNELIQAVFALLAAVITAFVVPCVRKILNARQMAELAKWSKIAVAAAEQAVIGNSTGAEKKAYALEFLRSQGIPADEAILDALIEAAVFELKKGVTT